jgi:hypothetical protein
MEERAAFLIGYAHQHGPVSVRGLYYQAEVASVPGIDKSDQAYQRVQQQVLILRRTGRMPYGDIADMTRWMRKPKSYSSIEEALAETARTYRVSLWRDADCHVEVWCEKDALAGVILPVTSEYDVPLMVTRGYTSETFAFEAVAARGADPRPFHVYAFVDFDRSGRDGARSLEEKLKRLCAGAAGVLLRNPLPPSRHHAGADQGAWASDATAQAQVSSGPQMAVPLRLRA